MEAIWEKLKAAVREVIPQHSYRMWIEPIECKEEKEDKLILTCPNFFSKKRVQDHYGSMLESEVTRILKRKHEILFEVSGKKAGIEKQDPNLDHQLILPNVQSHAYGGRLLRRDFTFDRFVVSGNNNFAYSAARSLASLKGSSQNALFLLSKTGMGKSHLSQAVGHHILSEHPSERLYYITAEDFTNEMVHAIRHDSIDKFKQRYRNQCDVLLLEDIHFLTGKERTQIELALTIDCLFEANKKIIFSSCYLPADIPKLNDKLSSRLTSGLISSIDPPNFKARVKILQKKSNEKGYTLPQEVTEYLADELSENVRQLESGLIGVTAKASLLGKPIDLKLAQSIVKNIARQRKNITIDVIKKLVCKEYKISVSDIISRSRKQCVVRPRQIAMYLSRKYTDQPLQTIGRSFNRYHATAMHSIGAIERELRHSAPIQKQIEFLSQKLESGNF